MQYCLILVLHTLLRIRDINDLLLVAGVNIAKKREISHKILVLENKSRFYTNQKKKKKKTAQKKKQVQNKGDVHA